MAGHSNGVNHYPGNNGLSEQNGNRLPRRLVLLASDEQSGVTRVLADYRGGDVSGNRLHADVQRLAAEHRGDLVAAEWLGPRGWTRFLWCRR
jgi:hypothetical protein